jgi:hypothetical protein
MKQFTFLLLTLLALSLGAETMLAGGPAGATGTTPRKYPSNAFPLSYKVDQGGLGAFSNTTAVGIADYAFDQWDNVSSAAVSFSNSGSLSRNVTSANDAYISGSGQYSDGINPVVFDSSGAITDSRLGSGASSYVLGFASSVWSGSSTSYIEGYAIINGRLSGSGNSSAQNRYKATITHEVGHFIGLSHAQNTMHSQMATMYPAILLSSYQMTLEPDDTAALAVLYPTNAFTNSTGSITGTVKTPGDSNLSSINVIAVDSATGNAYSTVVDYFSGTRGTFVNSPTPTGSYRFDGLPPGTYYIRIGPIDEAFTGGSNLASWSPPIHTNTFREWYNGSGESGDILTDNSSAVTGVQVSAGQTSSGINIVSNESDAIGVMYTYYGSLNTTFSLPSNSITKYAVRFVAPVTGSLVGVRFWLRYSSDLLSSNGSITFKVHRNTSGSLAGIPGTVLGSVTIPYSRLATDQENEVWLRGFGSSINFNQADSFHISVETNGVGTPVFYGDNGSTTLNRTSYYTSANGWRNFPHGLTNGTPGYNLGLIAVYSSESAGSSEPAISLNTSSLSFGRVRPTTSKLDTVTLTNSGSATLNVSGTALLGTDSLDYQIVSGGGSYTLTQGSSRSIVVRFAPRSGAPAGQSGSRTARIRITSDASSSPDEVALSGFGVMPLASKLTQSLALGQLRTGTSDTTEEAVLRNLGNDTLHVTSVSLSGSDAGVFIRLLSTSGAFTLPPNSSHTVRLRFAPTTRRSYSATLTIAHDDTSGSTTYAISGQGLAPVAALGSDTIAFGQVRVGNNKTASPVYIHNSGDAPLIISAIVPTGADSSAFTLVAPSSLPTTVQPGDSTPLEVRFTAGARRTFGATLRVSHDAEPATNQLVLLGEGIAPTIVANTTHEVGTIRVGGTIEGQPFVIRNGGNAPLEITELRLSGANAAEFSITGPAMPATLAPGDSINVALEFLPSERGQRVAVMEILSDDPESAVTTVLLSGTGLKGELALGLSSLDFGEVLVEESLDNDVEVFNLGTDTATVISIEVVGDGFEAAGTAPSNVKVAPGGSMLISVRFAPASTGSKGGMLRVNTDVSSNPLVATLSGRGVLPGLAVGRTEIDFGAVRTNQAMVDSVKVRNTGNVPLTNVSVAVQGGASSAFEILSPTASFTLAAGAEQMVVVRLKEQASVATLSDAIAVTADGGLSSDIALSATIVEGAVSVVDMVDFGTHAPGGSHDTTIILRNIGTATIRITAIETTGDIGGNPGSYFLTLSGPPITILPDDQVDLQIRFVPSAGKGEYNGSIRITTDSGIDSVVQISLHGVIDVISGVRTATAFTGAGTVSLMPVVPNPARSVVEASFMLNARTSTPVTVQLVDLRGRVMATVYDGVVNGIGRQRFTFDVSAVPSGQYQLLLRSAVGNAAQTIIVTR